jgi:hypothetical protein
MAYRQEMVVFFISVNRNGGNIYNSKNKDIGAQVDTNGCFSLKT